MNKLYLGLGAALVGLFLYFQFIGLVEDKATLEQANATLNQAVKDGEKERDKLKAVAALNSKTMAEASKEKILLQKIALDKARELEILKNENAEIKKWSINVMPHILAGKLFGLTDNDDANGLYITADGIINANAGTEIEVQNEALYSYTNELEAAVRSCNVDKIGVSDWIKNAQKIVNVEPDVN